MPSAHRAQIVQLAAIFLAMVLMPRLGTSQSTAYPQGAHPQSEIPIRLGIGDSLDAVQAALNVTERPIHSSTSTGRPETQIRLPERGIWVFLGPENRALQYRFDAPFAGHIHGARIGDSIEQTQTALGPPVKALPNVIVGQSFLYRVENGTLIRCDFDARGMLQTIRLLNGTVAFAAPPTEPVQSGSAHEPITPIVTTEGRITRLRIPASLAVTHELGCIPLDGVVSTITPPDLYAAIPRCLAANRYTDAVALFALAGAEASFDALRVTDKTAGQARQVLIMNTFGRLPQEQRQQFNDTLKVTMADPHALADLCDRVRKLAPPSYYPQYMILHGIKAFSSDPYENAIDAHFDAQSSWAQVQRTYLQCGAALPAQGTSAVRSDRGAVIEVERSASSQGKTLTSVAWSPDGRFIATAGDAPETQVWSAESLAIVRRLPAGPKGLSAATQHTVAFSDGGTLLAAGDLFATLWRTATWLPKVELIGPSLTHPRPFGIKSLAFSGDGRLVIVAYQTLREPSTITAFRLSDGTEAWTYHLEPVIGIPRITTSLVVIPGRNEVAFGTGESRSQEQDIGVTRLARIIILDARSGSVARSIERVHVEAPTALALSPDGRWLASATDTGHVEYTLNVKNGTRSTLDNRDPIRIWSVASGSLVKELLTHARSWALAFSPDGRFLIAGQSPEVRGAPNQLGVWSVESGERVQSLPIPSDVLVAFGMAFSPSGKELAVVGKGLAIYRYRRNN